MMDSPGKFMCSLGHQQQQARKKNIVPLLKLNPVLFSRLLFDDDMGRGAHTHNFCVYSILNMPSTGCCILTRVKRIEKNGGEGGRAKKTV